jgi:hypothetical protein
MLFPLILKCLPAVDLKMTLTLNATSRKIQPSVITPIYLLKHGVVICCPFVGAICIICIFAVHVRTLGKQIQKRKF